MYWQADIWERGWSTKIMTERERLVLSPLEEGNVCHVMSCHACDVMWCQLFCHRLSQRCHRHVSPIKCLRQPHLSVLNCLTKNNYEIFLVLGSYVSSHKYFSIPCLFLYNLFVYILYLCYLKFWLSSIGGIYEWSLFIYFDIVLCIRIKCSLQFKESCFSAFINVFY